MPSFVRWRRVALAAGVVVALLGLGPACARAEVLVACFVSQGAEDQHDGKRYAICPAETSPADPKLRPAIAFVAYDAGREHAKRRGSDARTGGGRRDTMTTSELFLRRVIHNPLALAALILMVGDVPSMPGSERGDPGGSSNGSSSSSGSGSSSDPAIGSAPSPPPSSSSPDPPPTAPEPPALISGLLGCGLTSAYLLTRRRKRSPGARWTLSRRGGLVPAISHV
jgi:hypothetical protein